MMEPSLRPSPRPRLRQKQRGSVRIRKKRQRLRNVSGPKGLLSDCLILFDIFCGGVCAFRPCLARSKACRPDAFHTLSFMNLAGVVEIYLGVVSG